MLNLYQITDELVYKLHKSITSKFKRRKVFSSFKDNTYDLDLTDMQLISKYNKGFKFLLCDFNLLSKYGWVASLKDKKMLLLFLMLFKIF